MTEAPSSSALKGALNLRGRGFCYQPLRGKVPILKDWPSLATNDEAQIRQWATDHPNCNFGIALGKSGHVAFDLDRKNGVDGVIEFEKLLAAHGIELPNTLTIKTPSGGAHLIFKDPGQTRNSASKLAPGVDVRGDVGFIVAAGGEIDGQLYEIVSDVEDWEEIPEAPPALLALANAKRTEPQLAPSDVTLDAPADVERMRAFLAQRAPAIEGRGGDSWTVETAMMLHDNVSEETALDLMLKWNETCIPPWPSDELTQKIHNAYAYAQNEPGCKAVGDVAKVFAELNAKLADAPQKFEYKFRAIAEAEQDQAADIKWHLTGLPEGTVGMVSGASGSGKTFWALDQSLTLTNLGKAVVYIAGEGARGIKKDRRQAWRKAHSVTKLLPFYVIETVPVANTNDADQLVAEIKAQGIKPSLIVIDTLNYSIPGMDENAASTAGVFWSAMQTLRKAFEPGGTVMVLHHEGRSSAPGMGRGSSAFFAGADFFYLVEGNSDANTLTVTNTKMKDGEKLKPRHYLGEIIEHSLVYREIDAEQFTAVTLPSASTLLAEAVATALGACGSKVTTRALAVTMAGPAAADDEKTVRRLEKQLQTGAKNVLAAFVVRTGLGRSSRLEWALPHPKKADETDAY